MSISSLGRSLAGPSLREPVSPLSASERLQQSTQSVSDLNGTQVTQRVSESSSAQVETSTQKPNQAIEKFNAEAQAEAAAANDPVEEMTELLQKRSIDMSVNGPLNRPDFKVIDRVNNMDFERAIPSQAFRERVFEMREAFISDLSKDNISFDSSSPLGKRVIVIKENINETEFVRHLPRTYNTERVQHLVSFASERGFAFQATA